MAEVRGGDGGGMYEGILGSLDAFEDRYVMIYRGWGNSCCRASTDEING